MSCTGLPEYFDELTRKFKTFLVIDPNENPTIYHDGLFIERFNLDGRDLSDQMTDEFTKGFPDADIETYDVKIDEVQRATVYVPRQDNI